MDVLGWIGVQSNEVRDAERGFFLRMAVPRNKIPLILTAVADAKYLPDFAK